MPRVPTYQPQVSPTALPTVRARQDYSPDEFGAGLGRGLQNVGNVLGQQIREERQRAEEAQTLELDTNLANLESDLLRNQQTGALNKLGKDAFDIDQTTLAEFDKRAADIEKGATSPRVKAAYKALAARRRNQLNGTLQQHIFQQGRAYEGAQADATMASAITEATSNYADPLRLEEALVRGEDGVRVKLRGQAPETLAAGIAEFRQKANADIVSRMLADKAYDGADAYLSANKDRMDPQTYATLKGRVDAERLDLKAESDARDIFRRHGQNLSSAYAEIDKIQDKDLRDKTRAEYSTLDARAEHIQNRAKADAREALTDFVDAGNDPLKAPAWVQRTLGATAIKAASKRYQNALRGDGEGKTDPVRFRELLKMSREDPKGFGKIDLYSEPLSNSALKDMLGRQDDTALGRGLKPFSLETTNQAVTRVYEEATGVDVGSKAFKDSKEQKAAFSRFSALVEAEVNARTGTAGKELDQQQIEEVARKLLVDKTVTRPGALWGDAWPDVSTVKRFEVVQEEIPAQTRQAIATRLQARGQPVTPENIYRVWVAMQETAGGQ